MSTVTINVLDGGLLALSAIDGMMLTSIHPGSVINIIKVIETGVLTIPDFYTDAIYGGGLIFLVLRVRNDHPFQGKGWHTGWFLAFGFGVRIGVAGELFFCLFCHRLKGRMGRFPGAGGEEM